jgi:hypothetical protein
MAFKIVHLSQENPGFDNTMNGQLLGMTDVERDIVVMVSKSLEPSVQCTKAARKVAIVFGQINRAFHSRDRHVFVPLYMQYVRLYLEFVAAPWSPWSQHR